MSLLRELEVRGVTTEDLEKAAAVRLFEKAAAAEGVNLDDLSQGQVRSLFTQFISQPSTKKEASAMDEQIVALFEKTAAAEGIDLDEMSEEELVALYEHYVENVLPEQIEGSEKEAASNEVVNLFQKTASAEGIDLSEMDEEDVAALFEHYVENVLPLQLGDESATDKVADAQEKLAEAEILGRHMARAYADEIDKIAADDAKEGIMDKLKGYGRSYMSAMKGEGFEAGKDGPGLFRSAYGKLDGKDLDPDKVKRARQILGARGGTAVAATGLAYGGKKLYDRRKKGQEKRSGFTEMEVDALLKIAAEDPKAAADAKEGIMDKIKGYGRSYMSAMKGEGFDAGKDGPGLFRSAYGKLDGKDLDPDKVKRARQILGARGGTAVAATGLAYGGKKLYDRRKKGQEKRSSAYDYDDAVNEVALRLLADAGYDV